MRDFKWRVSSAEPFLFRVSTAVRIPTPPSSFVRITAPSIRLIIWVTQFGLMIQNQLNLLENLFAATKRIPE